MKALRVLRLFAAVYFLQQTLLNYLHRVEYWVLMALRRCFNLIAGAILLHTFYRDSCKNIFILPFFVSAPEI